MVPLGAVLSQEPTAQAVARRLLNAYPPKSGKLTRWWLGGSGCERPSTAGVPPGGAVHTHQRRTITKLRNNPAAEPVEDVSFDGTAGAVFELPADLISFWSGRRKLSPEQARAAAAHQ